MIKLVVNHTYAAEAANIIRLFYGKTQIDIVNLEALEYNQSLFQANEVLLYSLLDYEDEKIVGRAILNLHDEKKEYSEKYPIDTEKQRKEAVKLIMYKLLSLHLGKTYPWGILTGIRPIKIVHELMDKGFNDEYIESFMPENYLVSIEKAKLAVDIAQRERSFIYPLDTKTVSIYIGIPFCPTRCHYCSFTSNSLKTCGGLVEGYLDALIYEMEQTHVFMNKYNLKVQTMYIGGGTPTSLNEEQLERLLAKAYSLFGEDLVEFTCEAGRPDTITEGKLKVLKQGGVTRISINPQTMNDETLKAIGRAHSAEETVKSFELARKLGFDNINMDIILGLPGEGIEHLERTLHAIEKLQPESLTVHTMAIKRASIINENLDIVSNSGNTSEMMKLTVEFANKHDLHPYYLYRQKNMVENLENIGYSKAGYECIYNIQIIEEKQTNIAFGADAITKTVYTDENRIERQANIKDIKLYISRIDEQINKKLKLLEELYK
ncbi:MAG: coproporphyrinogen dehydrogenase HemZ [Clostridia bacterium]|jgi:oxygen-independent coproporphyrinogen-3 oxidase|nr:coproporphyrinogen dehydrogenase HemZ [Clostridia bacterium]